MEYVLIALGAVAVIGLGATFATYVWGGTWRARAGQYGQTILDQQKQISAQQAAQVIADSQRADEVGRLKALIAALREEVSSLEKDVAACSDPAAVRARLQSLLGSAEAAVFSAGSLPPKSAPGPVDSAAAKPGVP